MGKRSRRRVQLELPLNPKDVRIRSSQSCPRPLPTDDVLSGVIPVSVIKRYQRPLPECTASSLQPHPSIFYGFVTVCQALLSHIEGRFTIRVGLGRFPERRNCCREG